MCMTSKDGPTGLFSGQNLPRFTDEHRYGCPLCPLCTERDLPLQRGYSAKGPSCMGVREADMQMFKERNKERGCDDRETRLVLLTGECFLSTPNGWLFKCETQPKHFLCIKHIHITSMLPFSNHRTLLAHFWRMLPFCFHRTLLAHYW